MANTWKWINEALMAFPCFISLEYLSESSISWKTFKNILFWRLSANKTGKAAMRNTFLIHLFLAYCSFNYWWNKTMGWKGKKSTTHRTLLSSQGAFKCKFLHKMVKTKKKRKPSGSIYYIKELSLSYGFQIFPSGTSKFFNTHQILFLNNCFKRSSVYLNRRGKAIVLCYKLWSCFTEDLLLLSAMYSWTWFWNLIISFCIYPITLS